MIVVGRFANISERSDRRVGQVVDCKDAHTTEDTFEDTLCRSYMKYFNDRYQTYGRTVHLYSAHAQTSLLNIEERYRPFSLVGTGSDGATRKILAVAYIGQSRAASVRDAPYRISFRPDDEDEIAQMSTFVCQKLVGRTARYSVDPRLASRTRKFGFMFWDSYKDRKDALRAGIRARCGIDITAESPDWTTQLGMAQLQSANVTTVIAVLGTTGHATASNHATQLGYFPEWFIAGSNELNGVDVNFHGRTANQVQWGNAFGVTFDYRRDALAKQPWYRAYKEGCPTCPEPAIGQQGVTFAASSYDSVSMLFYGIQAAGPRLTAENIDKGLHAIPARPSTDPFRPAAYFSPGNYSFMKDSMAIWWDPSGEPPGSSNRGCYRLPNDGRRFRAGEWPAGDDDVKDPKAPCQADTFVA